MTVAEVRAVVFYGSGRMPGFPTLAPDYTNAIVSYVQRRRRIKRAHPC